ncbi:YfiR family protein [Dasania sp. GY-MA-18]|uniref:YfiR family protein n=1 Tax=Dasania phycosphaerae TaxID=2950436 RepID=A0A9J6RQL2_9GAMM|nr:MULTISPECIES: YfiR family protein [Dasania]MCR8924206.1 YfiR family protein [Dasania sp. GY-MA-18]MCZ0866859.1 YfiR family protein [Dasania phycosphaerae]MCZ0870364.1 YfiR family protein [Dasania phycosphaerae]
MKRYTAVTSAKVLLLCFICSLSWSQEVATEARVKAAFLYKFCNYIRWPVTVFPDAQSPLKIAVINDDVMAHELQHVVYDRIVAGRNVEVYSFSSVSELEGMHVIYVAGEKFMQVHQVLTLLLEKPVLTVTEITNGKRVGMINFVIENDRVRFDIEKHYAEKSGLKLGAQLLSVARKVSTSD